MAGRLLAPVEASPAEVRPKGGCGFGMWPGQEVRGPGVLGAPRGLLLLSGAAKCIGVSADAKNQVTLARSSKVPACDLECCKW